MSWESVLEDSCVYQEIFNRGWAIGFAIGQAESKMERLRKVLLSHFRRRFGPASPENEATFSTIADLDRLKRMFAQARDASNWDELLTIP